MARGEAKTSARRIKVQERELIVYRLRANGASFEQIAEQVDGVNSRQRAHQMFLKALSRVVIEPLEVERTLHLERLRLLLLALSPSTTSGAVGSVSATLKVLQEIAKINDLYPSTKIEVSWREELVRAGFKDSEIVEQFEEMVAPVMEMMRGPERESTEPDDGRGDSGSEA